MAKSTFFKDFKAFISKGNILDMAVGVIIGGAFGKIITSLVNDIIMPPIGVLIDGVDFKELKYVLEEAVIENGEEVKAAVTLNYGNFIQLVIDFLLVALCVFIVIRIFVKSQKKLQEILKKEQEQQPEPEPAPAPIPEDIMLLREIRDSLKSREE